ncbi:hypothetical protein L2E82_05202 [Cichorium intybus]|uniref:Uncharacterized protein n=1 Tax=Cichorium intybus TaxID=13427 RepID=A0ACB9H7Z1_CICIN|nr:hypothetical protein L2E82_05202 [Cichorium intybus]
MRRFRLPEKAEVDQVKAAMENDVLTVTMPKVEVQKPECEIDSDLWLNSIGQGYRKSMRFNSLPPPHHHRLLPFLLPHSSPLHLSSSLRYNFFLRNIACKLQIVVVLRLIRVHCFQIHVGEGLGRRSEVGVGGGSKKRNELSIRATRRRRQLP